MIYNEILSGKVSNFCTICIVLFFTAFLIIICISSAFFYFHWYLKRDDICVESYTNTQATIY